MYQVTIGLEIHTELKTKSKMFCYCPNQPFAAEPNTHICEICLAHPGSLPIVNKKAIELVLKFGLAISGRLAKFAQFDRKNYFYPDIPKGYQISQFNYPFVKEGEILGFRITRAHLEEDTGKILHTEKNALIDFNRAGVPLMEIVTEPCFNNSDDVVKFTKELQLILKILNISNANLEKGEMRIEVNISLSKTINLGTKVEIKNLNSFEIVRSAIEFEIKRQSNILDNGEIVVQETRGWDEKRNVTFSQRVKENSDDYRYFPDPDIPPMDLSLLSEFSKENLLKTLGELPEQIRIKYREYGLKEEQIKFLIKDENIKFRELFNSVSLLIKNQENSINKFQLLANLIVNYLAGLKNTDEYADNIFRIEPTIFNIILNYLINEDISFHKIKEILKSSLSSNLINDKISNDLKSYISSSMFNDEELVKIAKEVMAENSEVIYKYQKTGDKKIINSFIGAAMKKTNGKINSKKFYDVLMKILDDKN